MMDKNGKTLKYTNNQYLKDTKRIEYQKKLDNFMKNKKIKLFETILTKYSCRTVDYNKFKEFVNIKNEVNGKVKNLYKHQIFRKLKWYSYINKQKAEANLVKNIKDTFDDPIIIMGDWSEKVAGNKLKFISTPNITMKRRLAKDFNIFNIDEYNTSKLNHITENKNINLRIKHKDGKSRKLHSVLTYKMDNNRMGCINRDLNAVYNMVKLVKQYLKDKTRPENFKREDKTKPEKKKQDQQIKI
jgi:hypothetical protein